MADILHKIQIQARPEQVYKALITLEGLKSWWTDDVRGESTIGKTLEFRFNKGEIVTLMKVFELEPSRLVKWVNINEEGEWPGTEFTFKLTESDDGTLLNFGHTKWREVTDLYQHCNTKWAYFLLSLKSYLETGKGTPHPEDLAI